MNDLSKRYNLSPGILKEKKVKYYPENLSILNTDNSTIRIIVNPQEIYLNLNESELQMEFEVLKTAGTRYADADDIRLVNLAPLALFSEMRLKTSSDKTLEKVGHLHTNILMHKLLTSTHENEAAGFIKDADKRKDQLLTNNPTKGYMSYRIDMKDIFGFIECSEKYTYGLGYILEFRRKSDDAAIVRDNGLAAAKIDIKRLSWIIPSITPSNENQLVMQKHLANNDHFEYFYLEKKTFYQTVPRATEFNFDLSLQVGVEIPVYVIICFQNTNVNAQTNDTTYTQLDVTNAYCQIGSDCYPEDYMKIDYTRNIYDDAYNEVLSFYKNQIGLPHIPLISRAEFKANYNFYIFDLRYQPEHISAQPMKVFFEFANAPGAGISAHALVLKKTLISISSDGRKMLDLVN